jgi:hypothetical protein
LKALGKDGRNDPSEPKKRKSLETPVVKSAPIVPERNKQPKYERLPPRSNQTPVGTTGRTAEADPRSVRILNDGPQLAKETETPTTPEKEFDPKYAFLKDFFDKDFSVVKFEDLFPPKLEVRREDQTEQQFKAWLERAEEGRINLQWVMENLKEAGKNNPVIFEVLKKVAKEIYDFLEKYRSEFKKSESEYHFQSPEQMTTNYLKYVVLGGGPRTNLASDVYVEEIDNAKQSGDEKNIRRRVEHLDEAAIDHLWDCLSKGCTVIDQDLPKQGSASYEWHSVIQQISRDIDKLTAGRLERQRERAA